MRKRIAMLLCTLAVLVNAAVPLAAAAGQYYPISVEAYLEEDSPRIRKVYQLSLSDDPSSIPTEDFERDGQHYTLLDLTRKAEVGVDTRTHMETVTMDSDTADMETILGRLDAERESETEDGYTGALRLDHTTVHVEVKGYATKTKNLTATRTYPNLSDADLSLIPKNVDEGGKTLGLATVNWSEAPAADGTIRYTATASYAGTSSSRYATGYTVTADYIGEVSKTGCEVVTYTAIFGVRESDQPEEPEQTDEPVSAKAPAENIVDGMDWFSIAGCAGGVMTLLAVTVWIIQNQKERRTNT